MKFMFCLSFIPKSPHQHSRVLSSTTRFSPIIMEPILPLASAAIASASAATAPALASSPTELLTAFEEEGPTTAAGRSRCDGFIDAHAHLIHKQFVGEEDLIAEKCRDFGLDYVIVNGLEPISNRLTLELCSRHPNLLAAAGIYPLDAACNVITEETWKHNFPPPTKFDVDAEIEFIESLARDSKIAAIGEVGLDQHYLTDPVSLAEQERVLRKLMRVGIKYDIPLILHTRKAEQRTLELLLEEGVKKADIHCFCGKPKLGLKYAEAGYFLSIPAAVAKEGSSFRKLVECLPVDKILTETDCPFMSPDKGTRNDPTTVIRGVASIAEVKGLSPDVAKAIIRRNFQNLFRF